VRHMIVLNRSPTLSDVSDRLYGTGILVKEGAEKRCVGITKVSPVVNSYGNLRQGESCAAVFGPPIQELSCF